MSQLNLDLVARAYEHLNSGEIDGFSALCHPAFQLDMSERVFNPATYEGHEGIRRFYGEVCDVWEEFRWEPQRIVAAGEQVVALLHARGRGRGSGVEIDRQIAMLWTIDGGLATSVRLYVDQAEALDAVGGG